MHPIVKFVPDALSSPVGRQILKMQKHSPTILFAGGIVGVVATAVMASRATLKVEAVLETSKENLQAAKDLKARKRDDIYSEKDYNKDVAYIYTRITVDMVKLYGPTFIVGFLSVAALTGSHRMLTSRNASITAAYAALDKAFREYRRRVVDEFGEETDRKFRHAVEPSMSDEERNEIGTTRPDPNAYSGYARFFDELCPAWQAEPEYNFLFLRSQQNYANDLLRSRGHLFLNEVYDMLSIDRTKAGSVVGWVISKTGDNYVDFGIFDRDHERARSFVNGRERSILLDFNVDGIIYDKI